MNWVKAYLNEIRSGSIVACVKIKAVYEREVSWMDNPPADFSFYFDEETGQRPIDFIEKYCKHSKGKWGKQPFILELFQKAKLQLVFGWLDKETHKRRFREVVDIRGRKCGKSSETAAVAQYMMIADGESGAEVYCVANKKDQAALVFNEAVNMRIQSPALRSITKKRQSDIYFPATFSFLKALASDTSTMDGLNAHFFSQDEPHEAKTRKLFDVMIQSQQAREQPLAWTISTNGFVREAYFDDMYNYSSHVALWDDGFNDYRLLPLIQELDSRSEWERPECWEKANPGLGKIKSLATLAENVAKAKRDPTFLPTVLTKDFNIAESSDEVWLSYDSIVNEQSVEIEYLQRSYAIGGCDLSAVRDLTCATLLIKKPNDDKFYVLQRYFLPEDRIKDVEQSQQREAPYQKWVDNGWMTACKDATVDFNAVTQWFVDMVKLHNIRPLWVCYDAALSGYWVPDMESKGFAMERIRQGPFTWSYPFKILGGLFDDHKIIYQNNPVLRWCLHNTCKKSTNENGIETAQPVKASSTRRIDGLVSLLNAFVGYCNHEENYLRRIR